MIAVLPPTLESTCASRVVGICTKRTPRLQARRAKAGEVADDAAAERDDEVAPLDMGAEQRVADAREFGVGLRRFARRADDDARLQAGALEAAGQPLEMQRRDVLVGDDGALRAGREARDMRSRRPR